MDKIFLNEMEFYGYHGCFEEENRLGQRFRVTMELSLDLKPAGVADDLDASVNYGQVFEVCREVVEGKPYNLIETVAEQISTRILNQFERVQECKVTVIKPDPPIPGHYRSVAVEITRSRNT